MANIALGEFNKILKEKQFFKLVFFYGEEEYLIENAIDAIKKTFINSEAMQMDFVKIDYQNKNHTPDDVLTDIESNIMLPAWMSEKRVVLIKNAGFFEMSDTNKVLIDRGSKILKNIPDDSILLVFDEKIDKRKKQLNKLFLETGYMIQVDYLSEIKLDAFVKGYLQKRGITITDSAVSSLISGSDKQMRRITTELQKIVLYCSGGNINFVDDKVTSALCPPDIKGTIFDITDSIGEGNTSKALHMLENLIALKEPVIKIRVMLSKHIRQLICAKELGNESKIISTMKVHPYVAKKLNMQARNFNINTLINLYAECYKVDSDIKHGNLDERQGLEMLLVMATVKR